MHNRAALTHFKFPFADFSAAEGVFSFIVSQKNTSVSSTIPAVEKASAGALMMAVYITSLCIQFELM